MSQHDPREPGPVLLTRRTAGRRLLGGAALAGAALGAPGLLLAEPQEEIAAILGRSGLGQVTGFAVAEAATGRIIESRAPDVARPPASVVKIVTALWALDRLGPDHRFRTRLVATGGLERGRVAGDLVLAGSGDPVLDTDALASMTGQLAAAGVVAVGGRFLFDASAIPAIEVTEPGQPVHAAYNPAICGLNLNFNRVHLAWGPGPGGVTLDLTAPGARASVPVRRIRAEVGAGGGAPRHRREGADEIWHLPMSLLAGKGDLWLPVRDPGAYAAEVFAILAARGGIDLPAPSAGSARAGRVLIERDSPSIEALMRGMLRHSTNLTAEAAGLAAARVWPWRPDGGRASGVAGPLANSAAAMEAWARTRWGLDQARFANHSGLSLASRLSPRETIAILGGDADVLAPLLPERPILDRRGDVWRGPSLRAKTGTMYFLRGYAGYIEGRGRRLAFAIYAADPAARTAVDPEATTPPPGARDWTAKARAQENALLRRWATLYAG